jgi:hypothetical protein
LREEGLRSTEIDEVVLGITKHRKQALFTRSSMPLLMNMSRGSDAYMTHVLRLDGEIGLDHMVLRAKRVKP